MQRMAVCAVIGWLMLAGSRVMGDDAPAGNTVSRQTQDRRALADCMTKRMWSSRTISYNEAARVCRDQMKARRDGLAAHNQIRAADAR